MKLLPIHTKKYVIYNLVKFILINILIKPYFKNFRNSPQILQKPVRFQSPQVHKFSYNRIKVLNKNDLVYTNRLKNRLL